MRFLIFHLLLFCPAVLTCQTGQVITAKTINYQAIVISDMWDWSSEDNVTLLVTAETKTVGIVNASAGKIKMVRIVSAVGTTNLTWPNFVFWANTTDNLPLSALNQGDTTFAMFANIGGRIIAYVLGTAGTGSTALDLDPLAISNLAVLDYTYNSARLRFTSPSAMPGTAASYDARYSEDPIADSVLAGGGGTGAVEYDAYAVGNNGAGTLDSATCSITIGTGTNRLLLVFVGSWVWAGGDSVLGVYNRTDAVQLTKLADETDSYHRVALFYQKNPSSGTKTVACVYGSAQYLTIGASAWYNVHQTTTFGTVASAAATSAAPSVTATSATGEQVLDFVHANINSGDRTLTPAGGQTLIATYSHYPLGDNLVGLSRKAGASSIAMDWTLSSSTDWLQMAVPIKPAGTGGVDTTLWTLASHPGGEPVPNTAGTLDTVTLAGLSPSTGYYVRMKSVDRTGHVSPLSNQVTFTSSAVPSGGGGGTGGDSITTGDRLIDPIAGNDGNPGTMVAPWQTIGRLQAVTSWPSGVDTVLIKAGTYTENLVLQAGGASASNPLVIQRYGKDEVIIEGEVDQSGVVVNLNKNNILLYGLTIKNSEQTSTAIGSYDYTVDLSGQNITLKRIRVVADGSPYTNYCGTAQKSRGIVIWGRWITLEDCFVRGWKYGIVCAGDAPSYYKFKRDTVYATFASNFDFGANPSLTNYNWKYIWADSCVADTSVNEDNIQWEPNYKNYDRRLNAGYVVSNCRLGNAVENATDPKGSMYIWLDHNVIHGVGGEDDGACNGIQTPTGWTGASITFGAGNDANFSFVTRYTIVVDGCGAVDMVEADQCYNNTFVNNRRVYETSNTTGPYTSLHGWAAWTMMNYPRAVVNNVFANHYVNATLTIDGGANIDIDNNRYYDSTGASGVGIRRWEYRYDGVNRKTATSFGQWRWDLDNNGRFSDIEGRDVHSDTTHPLFINASTLPTGWDTIWDFTPSASSTLRNTGKFVTYATNVGTYDTQILRVHNPYPFHGPFPYLCAGDQIAVGTMTNIAYITAIDYTSGDLTLDRLLAWNQGDGVHLGGVPSPGGLFPNKGAR